MSHTGEEPDQFLRGVEACEWLFPFWDTIECSWFLVNPTVSVVSEAVEMLVDPASNAILCLVILASAYSGSYLERKYGSDSGGSR